MDRRAHSPCPSHRITPPRPRSAPKGSASLPATPLQARPPSSPLLRRVRYFPAILTALGWCCPQHARSWRHDRGDIRPTRQRLAAYRSTSAGAPVQTPRSADPFRRRQAAERSVAPERDDEGVDDTPQLHQTKQVRAQLLREDRDFANPDLRPARARVLPFPLLGYRLEEVAHTPPNCSRTALDCPRTALDCPRTALDCSRTALDRSRTALHCFLRIHTYHLLALDCSRHAHDSDCHVPTG